MYRDIVRLQPRCKECGSVSNLEIHHRIFRSQVYSLHSFLEKALAIEGKGTQPWDLNDTQNLVRLCSNCHKELHDRMWYLRKKYRNSYTHPHTGANVFYIEPKTLW